MILSHCLHILLRCFQIFTPRRPTNDQWPTDLASWKISNGHISAAGHLIYFMFGSMVEFWGSADRMALLPVRPNRRWWPDAILENFEGRISATGHRIHFMFGSRVGFPVSADRMALLPVTPNPRWRSAANLENFKWPNLCNRSSDPLHVWF